MPIFQSGPHAGVRHDSKLWQASGPVLRAGEVAMGDKAYVGLEDVVAPNKKEAGQARLSRADRDYNRVHSYVAVFDRFYAL